MALASLASDFPVSPVTYFALLLDHAATWAGDPLDVAEQARLATEIARAAPWYDAYLSKLSARSRTQTHTARIR